MTEFTTPHEGVLNAEAPVALRWEMGADGHVGVYPLTPCCAASGKGGGNGVVCRACYHDVNALYGGVWEPDGKDPMLRHGWKWASESYDGWADYKALLIEELRGAYAGHMLEVKADELVAEARRQYEAQVQP